MAKPSRVTSKAQPAGKRPAAQNDGNLPGQPVGARWGLAGSAKPEWLPGTVTRAHGKFFEVRLRDEPRSLLSTIRGTLRRERKQTDLVAAGDRVWVRDVGSSEGQIEAIESRHGVLARLARNTLDTEQVILANADQVIFLFSVDEPQPHVRMLDRFLILAESRSLPALIGLNKMELTGSAPNDWHRVARELLADYAELYPLLSLSVRAAHGIDELRERLKGKTTAIAGPSGVGKSSLLNLLDPTRPRLVGEISGATGKGRHTTVGTELFDLGNLTFVADTAGIRALAFQGVADENLDGYFPDFRPFLGNCGYDDCAHLDEPGCAVIAAVEAHDISMARYESYASLRRHDDPEA